MFNNHLFINKKVLITGCTGFKGSWLSIWLNLLGAKLYGLALEPPTKPSLYEKADLDGGEVEATLTGLPLEAKELIMTKLPIGKLQMMNMVNREFNGLSRNVYVEKLKAEQTEVNRVNDHLTAIGIANDWEVAEDQAVAV